VCGLDNRSLKSIYDKYGDAGDVAFEAKKKQSFTLRKPKPLTIKGVYQSLVKIAKSQGQGSNEVKQRIVDRLLQDARGGEESRFLVRTLCQHVSITIVLRSDHQLTILAANWCCQNDHADRSIKGLLTLTTK
jgi:DNA ligase 1